jgi:hydrogenase expression/formation protein HypD
MAVHLAQRQGIDNFSLLVSQVLVPPAIAWIMQAPDNRVQAFLGPGHVCSITGTQAYRALAAFFRLPIVITGFEPVDLLRGVLMAVEALEAGRHGVDNGYARSVPSEGNRHAQALVSEVFEVTDRAWRGIGLIPKSGYRLRHEYRAHDAAQRFAVEDIVAHEPSECISGQVLRGNKKPTDCPAFGKRCTPETPLGATMVSAEGACAAYHRYGRGESPA